MTCERVMLRMLGSCPAIQWPPPKTIPDDLREAYTMNGRAKLQEWYIATRYSGAKAMVSEWTKPYMDGLIAKSRANQEISVYGLAIDNYVQGVVSS